MKNGVLRNVFLGIPFFYVFVDFYRNNFEMTFSKSFFLFFTFAALFFAAPVFAEEQSDSAIHEDVQETENSDFSKNYIDSIGYKNILPLDFYSNTKDIDFMALPYITMGKKSSSYGNEITRSDDDVFYKTIFINRKDNKISENKIKEVYEKFIEDFDGTKKTTKKKSVTKTKKTKKS